ncbi:metallophosphoesterase family protein [Stakelama pacifica]|uniref:Serine/threonine protein phosphatase 1 n=1 Tax=Stakelama pacifica TaxID=517720 RepID=A0A4R6FBX9_9SPHN|nr:metallophosphoesterase family protein [Stakelama pacifica]MAW99112.1 serine/threonine protein phosphatase [Sphingomonas sp.]TDN78592.1 serine/threonine protein phosphatase 1 [Stakelama pacifica]GGO99357.1 metallophosphoesterase [Stakelama pacifica]
MNPLRSVISILPKKNKRPQTVRRIADDERIYAIGDIHGRFDLMLQLLDKIEDDDISRPLLPRTLIFLGDLIDRGPDSAKIIEHLITLRKNRPNTRFLMGNHEEIMLLALEGKREALKLFSRIGGDETMLSYGVSEADIMASDYDEYGELLRSCVPAHHREFIESFEDMVVSGDYAFVHAGISPSCPLEEQKPSDLRWIRGQFLNHRGPFEKVIVHGHTISEDIDRTPHRIGIDTGAFASGKLTAIGLEGEESWFLQAIAEA